MTVLACPIGPLLLVSFSTGVGLFCFSPLLLGITSITPRLLAPFATQLAPERERGRAVGNVMSGLLIGMIRFRTAGSRA
jgi:predicted MFS family arabinose efflux permease